MNLKKCGEKNNEKLLLAPIYKLNYTKRKIYKKNKHQLQEV